MKRLRSRAILVATTLALVLVSTGAIAVFFASPAQAHSSTVTVLDGQVLVRHGTGAYAPIGDGDVVAGGDTVRTAARSHGVLTFFDGSTVELEPDTELLITNLQASTTGDKIVEMTQAFGRTWHVVTHLVSANSKYEIKTGASTAAVRGTAFEVVVLADGTTQTITTEGDVATSAQGAEVHVLAGQLTTVTQGSPPPPPQQAQEPAATVRITIDLTQNAIVTDANGRAVGVRNGLPVRYIPGSKVAVIDGKLVLTIPNAQLGVLSTYITPDAPPLGGTTPSNVTVQTEVIVKAVGIVANSLTVRPVENGVAKDAVVVTENGLLLVPNSDAQNVPAPHIGKPPIAPSAILPIFSAPTVAPIVTPAPSVVPATLVEAPRPLDVMIAAFVPYQTAATTSVNTGVVTITTPIEPVFKITATSRPTPAPVLKVNDPILVIVNPTPTPTPVPAPRPTPTFERVCTSPFPC